MSPTRGIITGINGNMVSVQPDGPVRQNEIAYVISDEIRLQAEVIRLRIGAADLQVFDDTRGLGCGDVVEFSGDLLSVELGPGLLGQVYDGLQNPLALLAETHGFFLNRGASASPIDHTKSWDFVPSAAPGDTLEPGAILGVVCEGILNHKIIAPFDIPKGSRLESIVPSGSYTTSDQIATSRDQNNQSRILTMSFRWPVKLPIRFYKERLLPKDPMVTGTRVIDTFFPVSRGGTYCIPGPFGAGKTVLQQVTTRHAHVDVVVIAACGERAGEVVETMQNFPRLQDPRTGRSLMERTVIICNTSAMPVAAREASIYTAVTIAEYYRQMGLHVLLLADSTSRWAQALRETSGRLEEIPGEEAFPAYLESRIAAFYERAGLVRLHNGEIGSLTIGGTVSPAGGNFEEPVTQSTLKVVGAFHGLSRDRANARRFPAIAPLESWSKYTGNIDPQRIDIAKHVISRGHDIHQMMMVIGEDGISIEDYILFLKSEFLDAAYLQQNSFSDVDGFCSTERQSHVFAFITDVLSLQIAFDDQEIARSYFAELRQKVVDWNSIPWDSESFRDQEIILRNMLTPLVEK